MKLPAASLPTAYTVKAFPEAKLRSVMTVPVPLAIDSTRIWEGDPATTTVRVPEGTEAREP